MEKVELWLWFHWEANLKKFAQLHVIGNDQNTYDTMGVLGPNI